jgi:hypothetical protein
MGPFAAMAVGYVIGTRAGGRDLDQLVRALRALRETEEFGDVVWALRSQLGQTLRGLADVLDGHRAPTAGASDLVDQVRSMFGPR